MGEELCRDEEWLRACADYTVTAFGVGYQLGQYPRWSRPLIHWFLPSCWEVRRLLSHARHVLKPHIERRNAKKAQAVASGDTTATFDDAIEWFSQIFKDNYDPATQQITLSLVAIHTTSDLLQQTMVDLAQHPELFQPLREELVRVLGTEGLKKSSLNNLKLMDSVLKESQRVKPSLLCKLILLTKTHQACPAELLLTSDPQAHGVVWPLRISSSPAVSSSARDSA